MGKGLSGGRLVLRPHRDAVLVAHDNIIAGNVIGYGATSGELFIRGRVGERFCVRNSGATAVVEGVGDHALEYMTGGVAVILGTTGRNLGAGMSGGVAYVVDLDPGRVNPEMVDLDPLSADDVGRLHAILRRHAEETESVLADGAARGVAVVGAAVHHGDAQGLQARAEAARRGRGEGDGPDGRRHGRHQWLIRRAS